MNKMLDELPWSTRILLTSMLAITVVFKKELDIFIGLSVEEILIAKR